MDNNEVEKQPKKKAGFEPIEMTCQSCNTKITTEVEFEAGLASWVACLVCSYMGLVLGCCLIPFLHKRFKDCVHRCPSCKQIVKRYTRLEKRQFEC